MFITPPAGSLRLLVGRIGVYTLSGEQVRILGEDKLHPETMAGGEGLCLDGHQNLSPRGRRWDGNQDVSPCGARREITIESGLKYLWFPCGWRDNDRGVKSVQGGPRNI